MYRLLPLLGDAGLGILSVLVVSFGYGVYEPTAFWLMPFAFLPDLDAFHEVMRRGKVAACADNPHDHRETLHKPILWLVPLALLWWSVGYYGAVIFTMVLLHFLHDSVLTGWGVPWLSPFSNIRIKFFVDEQNEASFKTKDWLRIWHEDELQKAIVAHGNENWIEDLYLHPTLVSVVEYSIFVLAIMLVALF